MKLYLDYNASTPLDVRVLDAMTDCLSGAVGNPSSTHQFGRAARAKLDTAREQVAALVGAQGWPATRRSAFLPNMLNACPIRFSWQSQVSTARPC